MATPPEHHCKGIGRALLSQVIADHRGPAFNGFMWARSKQAGRTRQASASSFWPICPSGFFGAARLSQMARCQNEPLVG